MNASKAIPEVTGPTAKCAACRVEIAIATAIANEGYCAACLALTQVGEVRQRQRIFNVDTKMGTCEKCGSKHIEEIAIGPWGQRFVLPLAVIIILAVAAIHLFLVPMVVGICIIVNYFRGDVQTLRRLDRRCRYCRHRWEVSREGR